MATSSTTGANKLRLAVITCLAHHGYRRAGVGFCKGENKFHADDFSESQLAQLSDDPRLKLKFVEADAPLATVSNEPNPGNCVDTQADKALLDEGPLVGDGLGVNEKLVVTALSFAEAVLELEQGDPKHFTTSGKPQCDVLSDLMAEPISASERDRLWGDHLEGKSVSTQAVSLEAK